MTKRIIEAKSLGKTFHDGNKLVKVFEGLHFHVSLGETTAIMGPSGSGKTTLLQLLSALDLPTHGTVTINGLSTSNLSERACNQLRQQSLGFIFQFHHLLAELNAWENIALPLVLAGKRWSVAKTKAMSLLSAVNLTDRATHKPHQLSGGERQRVAIARAVVHSPHCVLADEPTGNLDSNTAETVMQLLTKLAKEAGSALVIVTHDEKVAQSMQSQWYLKEGQLQPATVVPTSPQD